MPSIYALADIVVIPSLIEAVSLAALEALAHRKAVIATNVGGLPEIIINKKTGLLIHPEDPNSIAENILRLCKDKTLRETIANQGEVLAQKYSWDSVAEKTYSFYKICM